MLDNQALDTHTDQPSDQSTSLQGAQTEASQPITPMKERKCPFESTVQETPVVFHSTTEHQYRNGSLDEQRECILKDQDYFAPEIDVEPFIAYLIPPLKHGINIRNVILYLKKEGIINSRGSWAHFEVQPALNEKTEDKVFAPLADICERTVHYASGFLAGRKPTFVLVLKPNATPKSHRASSTRPDGYFIRREGEERATREGQARYWRDIGATWEFKTKGNVGYVRDNINKIVFNIQRTMTLDPGRRFTFGVTVQNTSVRLWFCSRSVLVVSKYFDFTKEPEIFIRMLLSFAFASEEELGWDPTVRPVTVNGMQQYQIDVDGKTYETVRIVSDSAADALISRATRVWKVRLLGTEQYFILKDIWLEDDRELEHTIHTLLLDAVQKKYNAEKRKEMAKHFLTPVSHSIVMVGDREDHTTDVIMRGYEPPFLHHIHLKVKPPAINDEKKAIGYPAASDLAIHGTEKRNVTSPFLAYVRRKKLHHRRHYRVIFQEVARALYTVRNLSDIFVVLGDVAKVLELIHDLGWVHRDISVGNLYFYGGRGLIGDFEYARHEDCTTTHEVRSGNADFMACEAIQGEYMFVEEEQEDLVKAQEENWFGTETTTQEPKEDPPFHHNGIHDLESLWWVAVWELLFHHVPPEAGSEGDDKETVYTERDRIVNELFPRSDNVIHRQSFFQKGTSFNRKLEWLPKCFEKVKAILGRLRTSLCHAYRAFERKHENLPAGQQARIFQRAFEACRQVSADIGMLMPYKTTDVYLLDAEGEDQSQSKQQLDGSAEDDRGSGVDKEIRTATAQLEQLAVNGDDLTPMPALLVQGYELEIEDPTTT